MESHTHLSESLRIPRAAEVALDGCGEAVLVFDLVGRLVYRNSAAQRLLDRLSPNGPPARDRVVAAFEPLGARVSPLVVGATRLADAVYVPAQPAGDTLATRERRAIVDTLESTGWRLSETARALGISRTTLWRRLRAYGLHRDGRHERASATVDA